MSFYPFVPHEISVLIELILGHLRYLLTDVPPQPNSPPDYVLNLIIGSTRQRREPVKCRPPREGRPTPNRLDPACVLVLAPERGTAV
jgi:hypothetical protein